MELAEAYPQFAERNVSLAAISSDGVEDARGMAEFSGANFPVLSDADSGVAKAYRIFDLHGDGVAAPATFILNSDAEIVSFHVGKTISERPPPDEILSEMDRLLE